MNLYKIKTMGTTPYNAKIAYIVSSCTSFKCINLACTMYILRGTG